MWSDTATPSFRVSDGADNVIGTHQHKGNFKKSYYSAVFSDGCRPFTGAKNEAVPFTMRVHNAVCPDVTTLNARSSLSSSAALLKLSTTPFAVERSRLLRDRFARTSAQEPKGDMEANHIHLSELRFGVIINTSSGGCDSGSEAEILDMLNSAGVNECKSWCGQADQMEQSFAEAATQGIEVLVVLGGDGTIRTAAETCSEHGRYLLPLPGGTMNMLPRALYGNMSWQHALKSTLSEPVTKVLSGGRAGDNLFFVAAIVGSAALWAEARESMREGGMIDAIEKGAVAFQRMFETKIQYSISPEKSGEAEVLAVICPLISQEMSDSEQALEAAAINVENAAQLIGLATVAAFGKWREDEKVILSKTKRVTLQSDKDLPIFLDGERVEIGEKAEISFVPGAANVIVPAKRIG